MLLLVFAVIVHRHCRSHGLVGLIGIGNEVDRIAVDVGIRVVDILVVVDVIVVVVVVGVVCCMCRLLL